MKPTALLIFCAVGVIATVLAVWLLMPAGQAQAQCTAPSTCKTCHEIQSSLPVSNAGVWHQQHAIFDFCEACHGGDRAAEDAVLAHQGLRTTYIEMTPTCKGCHPSELETCVRAYAGDLGLDDQQIGAVLDVAASGPADAATLIEQIQTGTLTGPQVPAETDGTTQSAEPDAAAGTNSGAVGSPLNGVLLAVLAGSLAAGITYVVWNERRLRRRQQQGLAALSRLAAFIRQENWTPYTAGVLLGITGILAVLVGHHLLSASGPVAGIASLIVHAIAPGAADANMYFRFVVPPEVSWPVMLFLGTILGGMLGAFTSGTLRLRWNDDPVWHKLFGKAAWKRILIGFGGALLLQYGASLAGGCTSGLAISGGMLLAPSAFLFMAGMFVSGIVTARIVFRRKY